MNPQHTVPTLDDNGEYIWESAAICTYLVAKYAKDDNLYPKDLYTQAKIQQRLHFNNSVLFAKARSAAVAVFSNGATEFPPEAIKELFSAYDFLEAFLADDIYLVGNNVTIADYCTAATVTTTQVMAPVDPVKYPKISEWLNRVQNISFFNEVNGKGLEALKQTFLGKLEANKAEAGK